MEQLALKHGVSREDIMASKDLAYHELPETLPFPKSFTRKYQSDFLNNYFLRKDRLQHVLPVQVKILSEEAVLRKYNTYLPTEIDSLGDILELAGMDKADVGSGYHGDSQGIGAGINIVDREPGVREEDEDDKGKKRILLLDLSQHFSTHGKEKLYRVDEQPLGLVYLLTYIKQQLGDKITGRVYKSGNDFDGFEELKVLVDAYKPDLLGIRTLTYYREFFHETVSLLRQWGIDVPIIAGGPYAASDYDTILKDRNIDLVVLGEGEYTLRELLGKMLENDFKIPGREVLRTIRGIVFTFTRDPDKRDKAVEVILADKIAEMPDSEEAAANPVPVSTDKNLAYVMYTSGSTGKPKGVMVEHRQVNNCICWMQEKFNLSASAVVAQRTNLTFDPSVWEIFWPLYIGGTVRIIDDEARIDVEYLTGLMAEDPALTIMYCPSTLLSAVTLYLDMKPVKPRLKLPRLIIGAEPVTMEVIKRFYSCYEGRIVNTYGPTEGVINNTYYDLDPADGRSFVPIGKPAANNRIYILSGDLKLLPMGIAGEICIAGASVARGYINDREKTLYSFINNPFGTGKLYKTGDVGRWLEDGNIEIMGRLDDQVKIRGHRIELGEIETALSGHPSILEAVVAAKTTAELKEQVRECKTCGIWSNYPGVKINDESICNICENLSLYKKLINRYFSTPEEMELKLREGNRNRAGEYDCTLVYACERVATYALYRLLDMGFKVLTVTYDSGHYDQESLDRIKRITKQIGVDHILLRHQDSDRILKESLRTAKTMCKGCIHTSTSLAGEYAYKNNIKFVIGETLSRGQIVENKLFKFLEMGIHDIDEIEREADKLMRNVAALDKNIFDIINIDIVKDGSMYDKVEFIDFYRYFNVTNEEMAAYLDEKDVYWKNLENRAIYSTDCKICKIGDYNHFKELGYHYTGSARSWEKRLGHATMKDVKEDLTLTCTPEEHALFLKGLGYREEIKVDKEEKHLCAYYVPGEEIDVLGLREYLAGELPGYMIPSYFIALDKIPLTANGKIDRKALPAPESGIKAGEDYAAPATDVEEKLKAVWEEVLGVDCIGVNDDLFKLGGDSIKAIRIVSKLQRYNLKLEIRDLFLNPTVKKAAGCVGPMTRKSDQGPVEGEVPLTPVQQWFFERDFNPRHYFNQSLMLYREQGFNAEYVEKVFTKIIQHHDALRLVFKRDEKTGDVTQFNRPIGPPLFDMEVIDLTGTAADDRESADRVLEHARGLQQRIDLASGPLVKLGLFKTGAGKGDHLLIIIHHLVVDGISWRVLLEDFETGYEQVRQGIDISFQDKTDSFKYWSEKLSAYAQSEDALKEADYWTGVEETAAEIPELPKDFTISPAERKLADTGSVVMTLDATGTETLLKDVHKAFNTEINDILLTALALALKEWAGPEKTVIKLEGHGRESIMDDVNISRTVGWFTTQFPVLLDISKENGLPGQVKTVKETLRQIPHRGIGYGILRHLGPGTRPGLEPEIVFNYLGQLGKGQAREESNTDAVFVMSPLPRGEDRSPDMTAECAVYINGGVANGELGLSFAYNTKEFKRERIETLTACYKSALTRIIEYCSRTEDTEMTAGDFDAVDLDADEMEAIYDELELE
jgi:amino acid adenylation domain-containing protein/non-ribosomal peptide synthase protein (TIGR01720 family)